MPDRATIANMAPEYGATMGFFPVDDRTIDYFEGTGRTAEEIDAFEAYFKAQGLYGIPKTGDIDYSQELELDLGTVAPSLAGPKRPQDRIEIGKVEIQIHRTLRAARGRQRFRQEAGRSEQALQGAQRRAKSAHGDVLIAAITSCTNTSNPSVLLAAGLLAKKAVERGLTVKPHIKTSLAPGSRVVTEYLTNAGLLPYLEKLGFVLAGYGCTTCIGNAGPLAEPIEEAIVQNDLVCAAVLSGNRNFEARIHPNLRANFLASPPLVVAYAIAGTMLRDLMTEPLGKGKDGKDVWIGDVWPTSDEIHALHEVRDESQDLPAPVHAIRARTIRCGRTSARPRARSTTGPSRPTSPSRRSSKASACSRARSATSPARAPWASSAIRSPPTTSARPARSSRARPRASTCSSTTCR